MPVLRPTPLRADTRRGLAVAAAVMVLAHVAFRAWAVYPSFFYLDDYRLVREAAREPLSAHALLAPYDSQLMPFGRFLAWIGARPDELSWALLATMSLALAALSALACLWMLVSLFGWRRRILPLLGLYLTCALTMPATMWWAASINQLPLQVVFFVAVTGWVNHLRGDGRRWLLLTFLALGFGAACYVKTLFVFPVLAFLAVAYFASGGPLTRLRAIARTHWASAVAAVAAAAGFLAYYLHQVPQITTAAIPANAGQLAENLIGSSFGSALLGGPWRWDARIAPAGLADPPALLVHLSWVVVALAVAYLALRRERTGRAWAFLVVYVAADYLLLLATRAQAVGTVTGHEYRYLTDAMSALILALGLATMELPGAVESSRTRAEPLLTRALGNRVVVAGLVVVGISGLYSSASYAQLWHQQHPGKSFFGRTLNDLAGHERIDLVNQYLSGDVTGALDPEDNRTDRLLPALSSRVDFPEVSDQLHLLADDGAVVPVELEGGTVTTEGPVAGCGWPVTGAGHRDLPLVGPTIGLEWWLRVDYLASNDSGLAITAGATTRSLDLRRGLHRVFVRMRGPFDDVRVGGADQGVTVCIDRIIVGLPEPSGQQQ